MEFTHRTLKLLKVFLENVRQEFPGAELIRATGIPSGNLYPILLKLEQQGVLESRWEDVDPKKVGRPRRRYYRLTDQGVLAAQEALRELSLPADALSPHWGRA